jgi:ribosomal protein S21
MPASAPFQKNPVGGGVGLILSTTSPQILKDRSKKFMDLPIFWRKFQTDIPEVRVRNDNLDDALRVLKKKLDASKIMGTLKTRCRYATTSDRNRAKRRIATGKAIKLQKVAR